MELLAPAGNFEKAKYALQYGADAIYIGGKQYSLRAKADNLDDEQLIQLIEYTHSLKKKIFITVNIYAHNSHLDGLEEYINYLSTLNLDGIILADPSIFNLVKKYAPHLPIHISTQANITNWQTVKFWQELGAKRVILARELTFAEIKEIREKCPDIELEIFVHGAMCISYSGRCLISAFFNNRHANLGECTHPCRWNYSLVEESRPGEYFPIEEDEHGTYFFNSKDLCLWNRLKEIYDLGIDSIKIEGRMKSAYYVANVVRTYKKALAAIKEGKTVNPTWEEELDKISHRVYAEGFFAGFDSNTTQHYSSSSYTRDWQYLGNIIKHDNQYAWVAVLSKFSLAEEISFIFPDLNTDFTLKIEELFDETGHQIDFTKPNTIVKIPINRTIPNFGILRKQTID
ncbi:MAG TPA: U32 family peptidase [Candidatus Cloacimonadota bacterium]|jgi:putative protease|nr:U32 family peptidase [Candidatus Cloacimonadales bacterium]HPY97086.1 U32 family peptidase [Candidatus Cloacimonadota bacterium]HQB41679.1 U32 family peptidase [Candidatus Cloacimonadota bacterium]